MTYQEKALHPKGEDKKRLDVSAPAVSSELRGAQTLSKNPAATLFSDDHQKRDAPKGGIDFKDTQVQTMMAQGFEQAGFDGLNFPLEQFQGFEINVLQIAPVINPGLYFSEAPLEAERLSLL